MNFSIPFFNKVVTLSFLLLTLMLFACILFALCFLTTDSILQSSEALKQAVCVQKMIHGYPDHFVVQPHQAIDAPNLCQMSNVRCHKDIIYAIQLNRFTRFTIRSLDWLPPGLKRFDSISQRMRTELHTAYLPRKLRLFHAVESALKGPIDLCRLPHRLDALHLPKNQLTGEIDLTGLPDGLIILDLLSNDWTKVVWSNKLLPNDLQGVYITCRQGRQIDREELQNDPVVPKCFKLTEVDGAPEVSAYYYDDEDD